MCALARVDTHRPRAISRRELRSWIPSLKCLHLPFPVRRPVPLLSLSLSLSFTLNCVESFSGSASSGDGAGDRVQHTQRNRSAHAAATSIRSSGTKGTDRRNDVQYSFCSSSDSHHCHCRYRCLITHLATAAALSVLRVLSLPLRRAVLSGGLTWHVEYNCLFDANKEKLGTSGSDSVSVSSSASASIFITF